MSVATTDRVVSEDRTRQMMSALERATYVRSARRQLKNKLRVGDESIVNVLRDPPEYVATMRLEDLLGAVPYVGRSKINRLMYATRLRSNWEIGGLPSGHREMLVDAMRERGWL